jgi:hypothetical protein
VAFFDRFRKKAEIELTAKLVRDLLRDQQPDLADRPLTLGARGWDNQLWRLGDDLAVRLLWQTETADALLLKEHTWFPVLAPLLRAAPPARSSAGASRANDADTRRSGAHEQSERTEDRH